MTVSKEQQETIDRIKEPDEHHPDRYFKVISEGEWEGAPVVVIYHPMNTIFIITEDGQLEEQYPPEPTKDGQLRAVWSDTRWHGVIGYMCGIDFTCELGGASGGSRVYPGAREALCQAGCGVVEVEVIGRRYIVEDYYEIESEDNAQACHDYMIEVRAYLEAFDRGDINTPFMHPQLLDPTLYPNKDEDDE